MKVILREDIPGVGKKHEVKDVAGGFVRNKLLPQEKVEIATASALKRREKIMEEMRARQEAELSELKNQLEEITGKQLLIRARANEEGHLFAGLHKKDIADEFKKRFDIALEEENFVFNDPIKEVGNYDVEIDTKAGKERITVKVDAE